MVSELCVSTTYVFVIWLFNENACTERRSISVYDEYKASCGAYYHKCAKCKINDYFVRIGLDGIPV